MLTPANPDGTMTGYAAVEPVLAANGYVALPLAPGTKYPPPNGCTGRNRRRPDDTELAQWRKDRRDDNVAIVMPDDVVVNGADYWVAAIDVDGYGTKTGAAALTKAVELWGPLPVTDRITSRDDGVSGIKLFLVPAGIELRGNIKFAELGIGDIDVIQWFHRYAVTSPSIHPEGRQYRVIDEVTGAVKDTPRPAEELPFLPGPWVAGLRKDAPRNNSKPAGEAKDRPPKRQRSVEHVTAAMTSGRPSVKVANRLGEAVADLQQGLSRYDTVLGHVMGLLRFGYNGEPGVDLALNALYRLYVRTVADDRPGGEPAALGEFERMCRDAEDKLAAEPPKEKFEWPGPSPKFGTQSGQDDDPSTSAGQSQKPTDAERTAEADFWLQRQILVRIHQFARSRRANPYAVLGAVLRRAITLVPPRVQLPDNGVGDVVSVNLLTTNVGRSGQGKDAANAVGRRAVVFKNAAGDELEDPPSPGIGTGEGMARLFKGYGNNSDRPAEDQDRVHLQVNEVAALEALADRKGATLVDSLLRVFMGQSIGFSNAQRATTTYITEQSYRLCLGIGAQPENAGFFLDREKDGLPQRFLWLPVVYPFARRPTCAGEKTVPATEVALPEFRTLIDGGTYLIGVPPSVREEIVEFHYLVEIDSPDIDPLDGHLMLVRLKVSFGLALLEGRQDINEDDWRIAGQLMDVSNRVRAQMRKVVADRHRKKNIGRAHDQAYRDAIVAEKLTERLQQRVKGAIDRKLSDVRAASRRDLQNACSSVIKPEFPPVFDLLLDQGYLVVEGGEGIGKLYRLANP